MNTRVLLGASVLLPLLLGATCTVVMLILMLTWSGSAATFLSLGAIGFCFILTGGSASMLSNVIRTLEGRIDALESELKQRTEA